MSYSFLIKQTTRPKYIANDVANLTLTSTSTAPGFYRNDHNILYYKTNLDMRSLSIKNISSAPNKNPTDPAQATPGAPK